MKKLLFFSLGFILLGCKAVTDEDFYDGIVTQNENVFTRNFDPDTYEGWFDKLDENQTPRPTLPLPFDDAGGGSGAPTVVLRDIKVSAPDLFMKEKEIQFELQYDGSLSGKSVKWEAPGGTFISGQNTTKAKIKFHEGGKNTATVTVANRYVRTKVVMLATGNDMTPRDSDIRDGGALTFNWSGPQVSSVRPWKVVCTDACGYATILSQDATSARIQFFKNPSVPPYQISYATFKITYDNYTESAKVRAGTTL